MGRGPRQGSKRVNVALACSVCGSRNYKTSRVRRDGVPALELRKFCKVCDAHTLHIESR